jgi:hypothetical protein
MACEYGPLNTATCWRKACDERLRLRSQLLRKPLYRVVNVMNQAEFEALLEDTSKRISGELSWVEDEDHSPAVEFRVEVQSDPGYTIFDSCV